MCDFAKAAAGGGDFSYMYSYLAYLNNLDEEEEDFQEDASSGDIRKIDSEFYVIDGLTMAKAKKASQKKTLWIPLVTEDTIEMCDIFH